MRIEPPRPSRPNQNAATLRVGLGIIVSSALFCIWMGFGSALHDGLRTASFIVFGIYLLVTFALHLLGRKGAAQFLAWFPLIFLFILPELQSVAGLLRSVSNIFR